MKAPLKPRRPNPVEVVEIATRAAPQQPPAQAQTADVATALNLRLRISTVNAITAAASERGVTMKQVIALALQRDGIAVAPPDLEDRTPRRR